MNTEKEDAILACITILTSTTTQMVSALNGASDFSQDILVCLQRDLTDAIYEVARNYDDDDDGPPDSDGGLPIPILGKTG